MNILRHRLVCAGPAALLLVLLSFHVVQNAHAATNKTVFAVVTELTGWAIARSVDGDERELSVGSRLYVNEIIVTGENTRLVAKGPNGVFELQSKQMRTLHHAGGSIQKQRRPAPKFTEPSPIDTITSAILAGEDPSTALEAPAAGPSGSREDIMAAPPPATGGHLLSAREFLFSGQEETTGYPLYSYLLFNREDLEGSVYQRRVAAIQGYLELLAPVAEVSTDVSKKDINIFYLPLKASLPDVDPAVLEAYVTSLDQNELAKHILDNYDFSRARVLLHRTQMEGDGPFIVSTIQPLSETGVKPGENVITQDLSHVPPELVKLWVQQFKYEAARWRTGEGSTMRKFALHLRTEISVLAEAFRITNEAVAAMIKEGEVPD